MGTSAVKLLLMDETGRIHKIVSRDYPISFPHPGWSDQNPEVWLRETLAGIGDLVSDCSKDKVAEIGVCRQMHEPVILDENDHVIRPAFLRNDGRTTEETDYLNNTIGRERLSKKHEPENFCKIRKFMLPKDYINYMLTGEFCTDCSDASGTLFFDVKNRCWSTEMLKLCEISENRLPKIYESYNAVGTLKKSVAETVGLSKKVKVCASAGDNAAATVGT